MKGMRSIFTWTLQTAESINKFRIEKTTSLLLIALLLATGLLFLPFALSDQSSTSFGTLGAINYGGGSTRPLHVDGKWIKDDLGNVVHLYGADRGGFNNDPYGRWEAQGETYQGGRGNFRPTAVRYQFGVMQSTWSFNAMRWTFPIQWWAQNTSGFRLWLTQAIMIASEYGIYIIIVPYSVVAGTSADAMAFPPYASHTGASNIIPDENAFVDFWASVATSLAGLNNVIFDLWNEPNSGNQPVNQAKADWQRVWQRCIDAIRAVSNNLILVQWGYGTGPNENMDWITQYAVTGTNLVYSTHMYSTSMGYAYSPTATYEELNATFQRNGVHQVSRTLPLIWGEVGAVSSESVFLQNLLRLLNDLDIVGYLAWIWAPGPDAPVYYGLLQNTGYVPAPNYIGQIVLDAVAAAPRD